MGKEKAGAWGLSLLMAATPVGAVANEATVNPLITPEKIEIKGEMASQQEIVLTGQKEIKIVDQRFDEFLNGKGIYSDEKLKDKMYYSYVKGEVDLGLCGMRDNKRDYVVQGVLLGQFEYEKKNFVAIGVKNKEKEREVVLAQWLVEEKIAAYSITGAMTEELDKKPNSYNYTIKKLFSNNEAISFLENKLEDVVIFCFNNGDYKVQDDTNDKIRNYYSEYVVPRRDTNINFVSGLFMNLDSRRFQLTIVRFEDTLDKNEEYKVINYSDVMNKLNNKPDHEFPLLNYIGYRK